MFSHLADYIGWRLGILYVIFETYSLHSNWWWFPALVGFTFATEALLIMLGVYLRTKRGY